MEHIVSMEASDQEDSDYDIEPSQNVRRKPMLVKREDPDSEYESGNEMPPLEEEADGETQEETADSQEENEGGNLIGTQEGETESEPEPRSCMYDIVKVSFI